MGTPHFISVSWKRKSRRETDENIPSFVLIGVNSKCSFRRTSSKSIKQRNQATDDFTHNAVPTVEGLSYVLCDLRFLTKFERNQCKRFLHRISSDKSCLGRDTFWLHDASDGPEGC